MKKRLFHGVAALVVAVTMFPLANRSTRAEPEGWEKPPSISQLLASLKELRRQEREVIGEINKRIAEERRLLAAEEALQRQQLAVKKKALDELENQLKAPGGNSVQPKETRAPRIPSDSSIDPR